jgi:hypothetical protein
MGIITIEINPRVACAVILLLLGFAVPASCAEHADRDYEQRVSALIGDYALQFDVAAAIAQLPLLQNFTLASSCV